MESRTLNQPEPIRASLSDWGSEFDRGGNQHTFHYLEIGYRSAPFELSVFQRAQLSLEISHRAARFYGRIKRDEALPEGERVPAQLEVHGFTGQGVRFGYFQQHDDMDWGIGLSLFRADRVMDGRLDGQFEAIEADAYQFSADVDYRYHRDPLFERQSIDRPEGLGWGLDLHAQWQFTDQWSARVEGQDLLAAIQWRDIPFTRAQANTEQSRSDGDGFTVFDPLLSGVEGYERSYRQRLDPRMQGAVRYRHERGWTGVALVRHEFATTRPGVGAGWRGNDHYLEARIWPEAEAVGFQAGVRRFTLGVQVDAIEWKRMQALNLNLGWSVGGIR